MRIDVPVPARPEWERVPARRLFERVRREPRHDDEIVTAFRDGEVTLRTNRRVEGFTNAVQEIGYQGVRTGDLVIHSMDGFAGAMGVSDSDGKASPVVHCYLPGSETDPRYHAYLLRILAQSDFITSLAKGIRERSTAFDAETFRSLVVPHPPLAEQRAIADYLDAETARIDALIAKKQQLICLLEDRWVAQRNASILRGVDPVLGTGALPEGWTCPQLGVVIELQRGHDLPADARRDGRFPVVSSGGVSGYHNEWACRGPAVVTGRYGTVGEVYYLEEDCWPLNTTLYVKDFRGNDPRWVAFLLESLPLDAESEKSAVGGINRNVIGKLRVPRPKLDEQQRIAAALARMTASQETTRLAIERQLDLLAEHRQALITAAVAGELAMPGSPRSA